MKRAAILYHVSQKDRFEAFFRTMTIFHRPTIGLKLWLPLLFDPRGSNMDRALAELHYSDRPRWVRMTTPQEPAPRLGRGGRQRCLLDWDSEVALMNELEQRASAGETIALPDIGRAITQRTGKRASPQAVSDILKRQGFTRVGVVAVWNRAHDRARRLRKRQATAEALGTTMVPTGPEVDTTGMRDPEPPATGTSPPSPPPPRQPIAPVEVEDPLEVG